MKKALILGAGLYYARSIRKIREGGFHTIAVDRNPRPPGAVEADEFYPVDIADVPGVTTLALDLRVDCVVPLNEFGMRAHAAACQALGLPGVSPTQAEAVVDKGVMRRVWSQAGLVQPSFVVISTVAEARAAAEQIGFPCLIKPADSGGSGRGIIIIDSPYEVEAAVAFAQPFARSGQMIVETFIEGTELTIEGLCQHGRHDVLAISDKYKPPLKTRVATSLNYPADLPVSVIRDVMALVDQAVAAIGLIACATHTEVIVTPQGQPFLVEMGARGGGGHIFSTIVEAVSGINMPLALARILAGLPSASEFRLQRGACYRFFNPPPGIITAIKGLETAAALEGVLDIGMVKKIGDRIGALANSQERAGYVVTTGPDRRTAWELANQVEKIVSIEVA